VRGRASDAENKWISYRSWWVVLGGHCKVCEKVFSKLETDLHGESCEQIFAWLLHDLTLQWTMLVSSVPECYRVKIRSQLRVSFELTILDTVLKMWSCSIQQY